jgi:hypothetical protein
MDLRHQLGHAIKRRIESIPAIQQATERHERVAPAQKAAWEVAHGPLDDEAAKVDLLTRLTAAPEILREATINLARHRDTYVSDRAYRLLSAAAADGPVQPIPPERAELFAREEALGRMSMEQAFKQLAAIEPALQAIEWEILAGHQRRDGEECSPLPNDVHDRLRELVGGGARREDELLRTTLAGSIAEQYLQIAAGVTHLGVSSESFFETPRKAFTATIPLWRRSNKTNQ